MFRQLATFPAAAMVAAVVATLGVGPAAAQMFDAEYDADWTGPYVGAQFGRSIADMGKGDDDVASAIGLQAGYRKDYGKFVLGGEVQYDWTDLEPGQGQGTVDGYGRIKMDAGYGVGQWLFYGTLGATHAVGAELDDESYNEWGWLAGVGADYMLSDPIAIGLEVQHHGFGELGDTGRDFDGTTVEAGITFRF